MSGRPDTTAGDVVQILLEQYHLHAVQVTELVSYDCRNFHVTAVGACKGTSSQCGDKAEEKHYVLKVLSERMCSRLPTTVKQIECSQFLQQRGFVCPTIISTELGGLVAEISRGRFAVLMTFLPGQQLGADPCVITSIVLYELGVLLASLHQVLQDCDDTDLDVDPNSPWALENMHLLSDYVNCIEDTGQKQQLSDIITTFTQIRLGDGFTQLHTGIIHGDFHSYNVLIDWGEEKLVSQRSCGLMLSDGALFTPPSLPPQLSATTPLSTPAQLQLSKRRSIIQQYVMIDFEEMSFSYPALELARLIADMMADCQHMDLLNIGGHVIAGYMSVNSLPVTQFQYLCETALTCLAQYIVLKTSEHKAQGGANDYVMLGVAPSVKVMGALQHVSAKTVYAAWAAVLQTYNIENPFPSYADE